VGDGRIDAIGNINFAKPALSVAGLVQLLLGYVSPSLSVDRAFNFALGFLAKKLVMRGSTFLTFVLMLSSQDGGGEDVGRLEVVVKPSM